MAKQMMFSQDARQQILDGLTKLADAVRVTMGPTGRNVIIQKSFGAPRVTKDGVSVSKEVELPQPFENMGAKMINQVASKTSDEVGDGTTAATGDATWLHTFYNTQTWTSAGGDFEAGSSASRSISGAGPYTWSSAGMVTDVQAWLDDPGSNFGWIVVGDESGGASTKRFGSRENGSAGARPTLTVHYTTGG